MPDFEANYIQEKDLVEIKAGGKVRFSWLPDRLGLMSWLDVKTLQLDINANVPLEILDGAQIEELDLSTTKAVSLYKRVQVPGLRFLKVGQCEVSRKRLIARLVSPEGVEILD